MNDDHSITSIQRKVATTVPGGKKTAIVSASGPHTKQIEHSSSQVNGGLNENLIAATISSDDHTIDAIDHCSNLKIERENADKTIVALSILIQHLTFDVSF